ncbi:MAG TPA: hypothetical protein H9712_07765, partial [Candidatus Flavonifractor intestinigallinarum]|nr:hypothetical protein [Candidatus Flavonifractor intestinigallinarum]
YINTFKYTPEDVDCKLCTEYVKKFGCTACGCPWMAERIEAGVVSYQKLIERLGKLNITFGTYLWVPDHNGLDDYIWEFCLNKGMTPK